MNRVEFLKNQTPPKAAWVVVAIGWIIAMTIAAATLNIQRANSRSHREAVTKAAALRSPAPKVAQVPPYAADAREALRLNSKSLDDALHQVEGVSIVGTQVRSMDVDMESGRAQVTLDFKDVASLKAYIEELNAGRDQDRWLLKRLDQRRDATGASPSLSALLELPL